MLLSLSLSSDLSTDWLTPPLPRPRPLPLPRPLLLSGCGQEGLDDILGLFLLPLGLPLFFGAAAGPGTSVKKETGFRPTELKIYKDDGTFEQHIVTLPVIFLSQHYWNTVKILYSQLKPHASFRHIKTGRETGRLEDWKRKCLGYCCPVCPHSPPEML